MQVKAVVDKVKKKVAAVREFTQELSADEKVPQ